MIETVTLFFIATVVSGLIGMFYGYMIGRMHSDEQIVKWTKENMR